MCGCSRGSVYSGHSKSCGDKSNRLIEARNKLVTLFNNEKDPVKRDILKQDRITIDNILKEIAISGTCPDLSIIVLIETEINNEYSKYNNT